MRDGGGRVLVLVLLIDDGDLSSRTGNRYVFLSALLGLRELLVLVDDARDLEGRNEGGEVGGEDTGDKTRLSLSSSS